jgi:heat-inducible transcriptional repressor
VTGTYRLGDQVVGEIGILGPTRMEYATAVRTVSVMTERLSRALNELFGRD